MAKSNLFEGMIEHRLLDLDGVRWTSPTYGVIEEPKGLDDALIVLDRNKEDRGGVNFEYGDAETELGFYGKASNQTISGVKAFIEDVINTNGSDANIGYQIWRDGILLYDGFVIPSSYEKGDSATFFRVKRYDAGNKLKTRWKTEINLELSTDLDGNAITPISMREMPLHSLLIKKEFKGSPSSTLLESGATAAIGSVSYNAQEIANAVDTVISWILDNNQNQITGLEEAFTYTNILFGASSPITLTANSSVGSLAILDSTPIDDKFNIVEFKELEAKIRVTSQLDFTSQCFYQAIDTADAFSDAGFIYQQRVVVQDEFDNIKQNLTGGQGTHSLSGSPTFNNQQSMSISTDIEIEGIRRGDRIYVYTTITPYINGFSANGGPDSFVLNIGYGGFDENSFVRIEAETLEAPTLCEGVYLGEALDKALEFATGISGMLESTLLRNRPVDGLDNDCAGLQFITSGNKLRGLGTGLSVTIEKLLSFIMTRYGAGYALYYDGANLKLLVEKHSFFFKDQQIINLQDVAYPVIKKINKDLIYNEIVAGYQKFARPNESGTIEGIATQTEYLTPIEKEERKLTLLSKIIADGTEIERTRRNGIQNAADQADEKDDDLFVISIIEFSNTVQYNPSLYGSTEEFSIERQGTKGRIIINGLLINGISINNWIILDGFTNRQITRITLDPTKNRTVLECGETNDDIIYPNFYFATTTGGTIPVRTYNPRRIEGIVNITGLLDPNSIYNLEHVNSQMLIQNFGWISGGYEKKASMSVMRFLRKKAPTKVTKQISSGACDLDFQAIDEGGNITLQTLRSYATELFSHFKYEIDVRVTYDQLIVIKEALRNEGDSGKRYGYITFTDEEGQTIDFYPFKIEYNPLSELVNIKGWQKA